MAQSGDLCGWIGAGIRPMTSAVAASLGMAEPYGVIFERPEPESPAARAGIQAGDVLTSINGTNIEKAADFAKVIAGLAPDTIVHLATYRDGQPIAHEVVLGAGKCPRASRGSVLPPSAGDQDGASARAEEGALRTDAKPLW
ncbi:MAG: PDZ domain-containing protein [Xanthobacteraceae bacterium]|nr:PDZ domain-containing protein [Xanthobacteraceae bacterium]